MDPNSSSFIRFQCILPDSGVLLSEPWNFHKLKMGDIISGGTNFAESLSYLVPPSVSQFSKFFRSKFFVIHLISMHFVWFRSTFLRVLKFLQIKEWVPNFCGEKIWQKVWIIWSSLLYFNFRSFMDTICSTFIRFQCILPDSGLRFSES